MRVGREEGGGEERVGLTAVAADDEDIDSVSSMAGTIRRISLGLRV